MADTYTVSRSGTVPAPPERVYPLVADFHRWPAWSPWEDLDPQMHREYSGAASGPGARYAWSGNRRAGKGSMRVTDVDEPRLVRVALEFEKPFRSTSTLEFRLTPEGDGTRVDWQMTGAQTLMTRVMGVVRSMDRLVGPDFEKGLARLRGAVAAPRP